MAVIMDARGGITLIDCVKNFLYGKFMYTRGDQESLRWISCFMVIPKVSHIPSVFLTSASFDIGRGTIHIRAHPFSLVVRIE